MTAPDPLTAARDEGYRLAEEHHEQAVLTMMLERDRATEEARKLRSENERLCEMINAWRVLDVQSMVAEFHAVKGAAINRPIDEWAISRAALSEEEGTEAAEAIRARDVVAAMHESADMVFVAFGNAVAAGYDLYPVIAEIFRANMSKASDSGGGLAHRAHKGVGYVPADVAAVLARQRNPQLSDEGCAQLYDMTKDADR